jgi:beta-catenin-like protein 1
MPHEIKRSAHVELDKPAAKIPKLSFASIPAPASATVEDADDDDAPAEAYDDEDARFLGGGISNEQAEAIDYINQRDADDADEELIAPAIDATYVKRKLASARKALGKNEKQRARFGDDPARFMESEGELDQEVRQLEFLSEAPQLYPVAVASGLFELCTELLGHENADIACAAIELLKECTDENVQIEADEMLDFLKSMDAAQVFPALVHNLARLDEKIQQEEEAYYSILVILENVSNMDVGYKRKLFSDTRLCSILLARMQQKEEKGKLDIARNKQYAAEVLSLLVSDTTSQQNAALCIQMQGVEAMLLCLAPYRKHSPAKNSVEEEFLENCFDILCCLVAQQAGKDDFIEQEGVGLMERLMTDTKAAKQAKHRAIEVLDFACGSWHGGAVCFAVVQAGLLKHLFAVFMKTTEASVQRSLLSLFASFFRTLNPGEAERFRVLNKFGEKQRSKLIHLCNVHKRLHAQRQAVQAKIVRAEAARPAQMTALERQEYDLVNLMSLMDEGGLDALQLCDTVLAWLAIEDAEMRMVISAQLDEASLTFESISQTLREMSAGLEDAIKEAAAEVTRDADERAREAQLEREMVETLIMSLDEHVSSKGSN